VQTIAAPTLARRFFHSSQAAFLSARMIRALRNARAESAISRSNSPRAGVTDIWAMDAFLS
jgi:hypothetical protein